MVAPLVYLSRVTFGKSMRLRFRAAGVSRIHDPQHCFRFCFLARLGKNLGELGGKRNVIRIGIQSVAENAFGILGLPFQRIRFSEIHRLVHGPLWDNPRLIEQLDHTRIVMIRKQII